MMKVIKLLILFLVLVNGSSTIQLMKDRTQLINDRSKVIKPNNDVDCALDLTIPAICSNLPYREISKSNKKGLIDQQKINTDLLKYEKLFKSNCSEYLEFLICSYYLPLCTVNLLLEPCGELCNRVYDDCKLSMTFDTELRWPNELKCSQFELYQKTKLCFIPNKLLNESISTTNHQSDQLNEEKSNLICPIELRTSPNSGHFFRISNHFIKDCAYPCDQFYSLDQTTTDRLRLFILIQSTVCFFLNLLLQLTFLIDRKRFQYPVKSIVYISFFHLCISLIYIVGHLANDRISCHLDESDRLNLNTKILAIGNRFDCKFSFALIYFFTISSLLWWIMLSISFLIQMIFFWSDEVFNKKNYLINIFLISIAGLSTQYTMNRIDLQGDHLTGLCTISLKQHFNFLILPELILLIIGISIFLLTLAFYFKIRRMIEVQGFDTKKFENFVAKLMIFEIIFVCSYLAQFMVFIYEILHFDIWVHQWYLMICNRFDQKFTCPQWIMNWKSDQLLKPTATFAIIKYITIFLPILAIASFLLTGKTIKVWSKFLRKKSKKISISN